MAVPTTGPLSLGRIRQELETANYNAGPFTSAATELDNAENGSYDPINTCSPSYPLAANAARMSEWYGYDHDAVCAFALNTGTGSNMLVRTQNDWGNAVSTTNPGTTGTWMINFWIKHINDTNYQGYISNLSYNSDGYPGLAITWDSYYDANEARYFARMGLRFYDAAATASANEVISQVILNDDANYNTTGIEIESDWNASNPGSTANSGYKMITISYNYNNAGTDDMITWSWNGTALTVPYTGTTSAIRSYTYDYGVNSNNYGDNGKLIIGGIYPYEVGSGLYLDEYTFDPFDDNQGVASTLWNSGVPLSTSSLASNLGTNILHYDFNDTASLGTDVAKNYSHNLSDYNSPGFTTDSAD